MTKPDYETIGEQRHNSRRSAFFRYVAIAFAVALVAGAVTGAGAIMVKVGDLPIGVLIAVWVVVTIGFIWFSRDYFRKVDELDLSDNLWACTIGLYGNMIAYGTWWFFNRAGALIEPDAGAIFWMTFALTAVAYFARRLGLR